MVALSVDPWRGREPGEPREQTQGRERQYLAAALAGVVPAALIP